MHALLADLWPWIVAFYVADGLVQLRSGHLLLSSAGGRFALLRAGLHLPGLSPLAEAIALHDLPFLHAGARLWFPDPRRSAELPVVEPIDLREAAAASHSGVEREGRKLKDAGELLLVSPTPEGAEVSRERLAALASGRPPPPAPGFDAARARRAAQAPFVAALRVAGALLSALVLLGWPAVAWGPPALGGAAGALLAATGVLVTIAAGLTFAMWRACGEPAGRSAAAALHLVSWPVAALHPLWHASRALYARFEPLAVAAALLPRDRFALLAGRELRRAAFSRSAGPTALAPAWDGRTATLEALLRAAGIRQDEALAPPARHADAGAWCPLCRVQWRPGFDRCDACGVPLERFTG